MYFVVILACLLQTCVGSRVLVVFPVPSRSHTVLGDSLVKILLEAGHEVTYISSSTFGATSAALKLVDISSVADTLTDLENPDLMDVVRNPRPPQRVLEVGTNLAYRVLQHEAVQALLMDPDLTFDAVVAEWYYTGLLAPLATLFECPLIWYSTVDANWMNLQLMHGQTNPAYSVGPQAPRMAAPPYSLRDRLDRLRQQAYLTAWTYYMTYYVEASSYHDLFRNPLQLRARYPPNYEDVVYNASLLLINSSPPLGQILALPPNTKYIGGHHIETPTKQLPKTLHQLLDQSRNGVIFLNLGPNVRSKHLTDYMKRQLLDVFGQLEQTVIWEFEEPFKNLPRNVHIVKRAPQASILNHTNTVLVISHGSSLPYIETVYYGVPLIGIPIYGDQLLTMDVAAKKGFGIRVSFTDYLPYKLKDAINEILGNYSYRSNAKKAAAILQNPLVMPRKEVLYWIELVLQHGGEHFRSPALQLSTVERLHLDVVAVIAMFLWFLSKVVKVIQVHWKSEIEDDKKNQ